MRKKLTIVLSDEVYEGLHARFGPDGISRFLDSLARPHVVDDELDQAYKAMSEDQGREADALESAESLVSDSCPE